MTKKKSLDKIIKKKKRLIKLVSSANTGHYYTTTKSKDVTNMSLKKFDPVIRKHVKYNEKKIK